MITSFCMHDCIEKGKDCTDKGAVRYNYTSVNVLGVPNVSDSIYAIKELIFNKKKTSSCTTYLYDGKLVVIGQKVMGG